MIPNKTKKVKQTNQNHQGSSLIFSASGGWDKEKNHKSAEKIARDFQQAGKKKKGCGENEFLPACSVPKARQGWESVSAIPASAGRQNRKIFVSLIEKNFGGARLDNCKENFSVLLAVRRAEMLGGIQSAKSSGFCSKWVRISSNKHHQKIPQINSICGIFCFTPVLVLISRTSIPIIFRHKINISVPSLQTEVGQAAGGRKSWLLSQSTGARGSSE